MNVNNTVLDLWQEKLEKLGAAKLKLSGDSMAPTMVKGDEFMIAKVSLSSIRAGDIVTYRASDHLITHRIIGKSYLGRFGTLFWEAGDNSGNVGRIDGTAIVGKVVKVMPKEGPDINIPVGRFQANKIKYLPSAILCALYAIPYYLKLRIFGRQGTRFGRKIRNVLIFLIGLNVRHRDLKGSHDY